MKLRNKELFEKLINDSEKCIKCDNKNKLTIDHVIPKRTLKAAGVPKKFWNREYNLQVFCKHHNLQKHHYVNLDLKTIKLMIFYWVISKII